MLIKWPGMHRREVINQNLQVHPKPDFKLGESSDEGDMQFG